MELIQIAQHGYESYKGSGVMRWSMTQSSEVSTQNRSRITARENHHGGEWVEGWFVFPTFPHEPELSDCLTRIKWERI